METGGAVLECHYDAVNVSSSVAARPSYRALREEFPSIILPGAALHYPDIADAPASVQGFAAELHSAGVLKHKAIGALAHNTVQLGWHQDRLTPPGCWNATVVMRERCTGGMLVLARTRQAFRMLDGEILIFDAALEWHGLTPIACEPGGWRIAVSLYVPGMS